LMCRPQSQADMDVEARKKAAHREELRKQVEENKRRKAEEEAKRKAEDAAIEARIKRQREELARKHAEEEKEAKRKAAEQERVRRCGDLCLFFSPLFDCSLSFVLDRVIADVWLASGRLKQNKLLQ